MGLPELLGQGGREVEIGSFLSEDERKALYGELADALRSAATPRPEPAE